MSQKHPTTHVRLSTNNHEWLISIAQPGQTIDGVVTMLRFSYKSRVKSNLNLKNYGGTNGKKPKRD